MQSKIVKTERERREQRAQLALVAVDVAIAALPQVRAVLASPAPSRENWLLLVARLAGTALAAYQGHSALTDANRSRTSGPNSDLTTNEDNHEAGA